MQQDSMSSGNDNPEDMALGAGLTLLRASRLGALVEPLHALLTQTRPEHPLQPQTVVVAHPGMKHWLVGALARALGPGRVVANLDLQMPSGWLDALSVSLLSDRAVALPQYRRGHLRWTLHAMLEDPAAHGVTAPGLSAFLDDAVGVDERARRRFQLADRLASVYSQYLVYRGDWLAAWEAGKQQFVTTGAKDDALRSLESRCLAPLWQATVAALGEHRGRLVQALPAALAQASDRLPPLHVFGLSHLPPVELAVLRGYARHAPVFLYVPDPCREFWGGLFAGRGEGRWRAADAGAWQSFRTTEQAILQERLQDPDALDWREQGHPLLARWGRMGQHFFAALAEGEVREDTRHWQDQQPVAPTNRLTRLQESIRALEPALLHEDTTAAMAREDASLRVHACHTRLRELEVLRDALLDAIGKHGVHPGEIVVMAPDIQRYLSLIPSVFGEPGSPRERLLPFHLADVPVARSHPLFALFETLLGIGTSRITAPEVVDLLGVAEVQRALGLDAADADNLLAWLRESRVAWGLDGTHKASLQLPECAEYSFAWAMDRMLAGYVMGDAAGNGVGDGAGDEAAITLPDGVVLMPLPGIDGPSASAIGALDRLLRELQAWRALADVTQPASSWAETLRVRVDALLRIDTMDVDAREAQSAIHRAIALVVAEPERNGQDPELRLSVVRDLLLDALGEVPERQRHLLGGITFCGMVPQRAIPFQMICVLGLEEGSFPRRIADGGIDLATQFRRLGDRDVPGDDRYLFLETVMSAGKRLHLSFIGQNVRDGKPRNPATPLAELLSELESRCGIAVDDKEARRPWFVQHPLQPFDARYFDGADPALFSYSRAFAEMTGDGSTRLPSLRQAGLPDAEPWPDPLPLPRLLGVFKDPAKALLKDRLQLSLQALDAGERLPEVEPIDGISALHTVASRVFLGTVLPRKCADPSWAWDRVPPDWLRHGGLLPPGDAGQQAWAAQADAVSALLAKAEACECFDLRSGAGAQAIAVDVRLADETGDERIPALPERIVGTVRNVFPLRDSVRGVQVVVACPESKGGESLRKPEALTFSHRVPAFLHWALLRLQCVDGDSPAPVRLTMLADAEPDLAARANAWDARYCAASVPLRQAMAADLRGRIRGLVGFARSAVEGGAWYYPKISWAAVSASEAVMARTINQAWVRDSGETPGERDYAPGFTRLLEGELRFGDADGDPDALALNALHRDAHTLQALLLLGDADASGVAGTSAAEELP